MAKIVVDDNHLSSRWWCGGGSCGRLGRIWSAATLSDQAARPPVTVAHSPLANVTDGNAARWPRRRPVCDDTVRRRRRRRRRARDILFRYALRGRVIICCCYNIIIGFVFRASRGGVEHMRVCVSFLE